MIYTSLNMTVGTFNVGKTIEFPAIINNFVEPEEFLTEEDTYELDKIFGDFYNRLIEKNITPNNIVENQKQVTDEFVAFLLSSQFITSSDMMPACAKYNK